MCVICSEFGFLELTRLCVEAIFLTATIIMPHSAKYNVAHSATFNMPLSTF